VRALKVRRVVTLSIVAVLVVAALAMGLPVVLSPPRSVVIAPTISAPSSTDIGAARVSVIVHLVGAVAHPGLIVLSPGARVIDAVLRAGGLVPTADQCAVNLARALTDGEQIVIPIAQGPLTACNPSTQPSTISSGGSASGVKVSLTRASLEQLDSLPGVGPALAQRIIDWRTAHGGFQNVTQLDQVSGIGVKLLASLKPLVTP
jgi:competence protein ComEA